MHQQLSSLMRCITHSNIPHPLLLTQIRYRYVKRPPPPLTARDQAKENYWEAVLGYLDPSEEKLMARSQPVSKEGTWKLELKLKELDKQKLLAKRKPQFRLGFDLHSEPIKSDPTFKSPARNSIGRKSGAKYKNRVSVLSEVYQSMDELESNSDRKVIPLDVPSNEDKAKEFVETAETSQTDLDPEIFEDEEIFPVETQPKFLEVLRESNWMKMGDPIKKTFRGIVINQIGNQVYVDYGYKFYGAFKIPEGMETEQFVTGTKLLVLVKELEMTQHFLGEDSMFSLLESEIQFQSLIE